MQGTALDFYLLYLSHSLPEASPGLWLVSIKYLFVFQQNEMLKQTDHQFFLIRLTLCN